MQTTVKDLTEVMLRESTIGSDIAKMKERCLASPLIRSCEIEVERIRGRRVGSDSFDVDLDCTLSLSTRMLVGLKLSAAGRGRIEGEARRLQIMDVHVRNDFLGFLAKLIEISGYASGRVLNVARKDIDILRRELQ